MRANYGSLLRKFTGVLSFYSLEISYTYTLIKVNAMNLVNMASRINVM